MDELKQAIATSGSLRPISYDWDTDIVLAVDTSWMAVGIQIYQMDLMDKFKKHYAKFASITLNRRESRFSQPKRELYGLKRALEATSILGAVQSAICAHTGAQALAPWLRTSAATS
jgi:hypothetical protein